MARVHVSRWLFVVLVATCGLSRHAGGDDDAGDAWRNVQALLDRGQRAPARSMAESAVESERPALRRYASDASTQAGVAAFRAAARTAAEPPLAGMARRVLRAVSLGVAAGPSIARVDLLLDLAVRLEAMGSFGACAIALLEAGACAESIGWSSEAIRIFEAGAGRARSAGLLALARRLAVARARVAELTGSDDQRIQAWIDEGAIEGELGDVAASRIALLQAARDARHLGLPYAEATAALNLLMSFQSTVEVADAERWGLTADRAIAKCKPAAAGPPTASDIEMTRAVIQLGRGNLALRTSRPRAAIPFYEEVLAAGVRLGIDELTMRARGNLGGALVAAGELDRGVSILADSVTEAESRRDPSLIGRALGSLADALRRKGDLLGADLRLRDALARVEGGDDPVVVADLRHDHADLLLRMHRPQEAVEEYEEVLRISRGSAFGFGVVRAWGGLSRAWSAMDEPWQALACARCFYDALSRGSAGMGDEAAVPLRAHFGDVFDAARIAALRISGSGDSESGLEELFFAAEASRAAGLSRAVTGVGPQRATDPDLEAEASAAREADRVAARALVTALSDASVSDAQIRRLQSLRRSAGNAADLVSARLALAGRRELEIVAEAVPRLDVLRRRLAAWPLARMLVVSLGRPNPFVLALSPSAVRRIPLQPEADGRSAPDGVAPADSGNARWRSIERLRRSVEMAVGKDAGRGRLFIVPDERSADLPFPALFPDADVILLPRAGWLLTAPSTRELSDVIALADPVTDLAELPGARGEAVALADEPHVGAAASETRLRALLASARTFRCLLLAAHVEVDPYDPYATAVVLTGDELEDGRLTGRDVLSFDLRGRTELVVLSACEGAVGTVARGEGVLGLHRAFLLAGAPRVLASLWKVDDAATARFMEAFFDAWNPRDPATRKPTGKGVSAAEALRLAQKAVREDTAHPEWRDPKYWAAWVLWGLPE